MVTRKRLSITLGLHCVSRFLQLNANHTERGVTLCTVLQRGVTLCTVLQRGVTVCTVLQRGVTLIGLEHG
jgi:hypothetical protein